MCIINKHMAGFHTKTFLKHDDYMTPKSAWSAIEQFIPKDKKIWEAFYGDGKSGQYLRELGFDVIHEPIDFFEEDRGDVIVTNPAFSLSKQVIQRLVDLDKPFIIILPASKICTSYFRDNLMNKGLQIIIPRKRIHFEKLIEGKKPENWNNACNFDCFYYCYRLVFPRYIVWL